MYDFLIGRIDQRAATRLVLDVFGIGYDIAVPLGADFPKQENGDVRVFTHLVVREDAHLLFGFPDRRTRELFRLLLKVRGVGPGLAQAILSSLREEELLSAIADADPAQLTRIKGVGKKTADQILLDLRDKAPRAAERGVVVPASREESQRREILADAVQALLSIGYTDKQAQSSVERAAKKVGTDSLEELVRAALRE